MIEVGRYNKGWIIIKEASFYYNGKHNMDSPNDAML